MKINKLYVNVVLALGGVALVYYLATGVVPQVLVTLTKAAPASVISISNSYFIGGNLLAKADGIDSCVVNVFALDSRGQGVKNKNVEVIGMGDQVLTGTTDADGKVSFKVVSSVEGQFKLSATVEGIPVGRVVAVTFRN